MKFLLNKLNHYILPILFINLAACGGGGGGDEPPPPPVSFTLGGNVSGLQGDGLTLQNNSANDLSVSADGAFSFVNRLNSGANYSVSVSAQPTSPAQTCEVTNATGTITANVSNVTITCTSNVVAVLPSTTINFDTTDVQVGEVKEELVGETQLVMGDPQMVTYDYDINDPDSDNPQETDVEVRMACTTKTYNIKSNPEKILLHGVNDSHRWPGALLQGQPYRDGTMRSLNVSNENRKPVTVIIKNVYNNSGNSSSRTVENPSQSTITDAVNELIIDGYNDNLPLGGSVQLSIEETKGASRSLLKGKFSARYGTVRGSLQAGVDNSQSHNSLMINLTQNLFDVVVEEPPNKEAWFKDEFYQQELAEKIANGDISETNPPVYVSKVTYGRILNFTMSSTASRSELNAIAKLSQNTLVASGSLTLSTNQQKIQDNLQKSVISIGGNNASAVSATASGDWGTFFAENLSLTEAVPIAFEFKNVHDNTPAGVTEVTEYNEEICTPQIVVPGPFDFALEDIHKRPVEVGNIQQLVSDDFNGDGHTDILWNHLTGDENIFYVGYGTNEGRFDIAEKACGGEFCDLSGSQIPWGQFKLASGDFNGDGKADLIWTRTDTSNSLFHIKISLASEAGFSSQILSFEQTFNGAGLQDKIIFEDMNNDGVDDIVLWFVNRAFNFTLQQYQVIRTSVDENLVPDFLFQTRVDGYDINDIAYPDTRLDLNAEDINSDGWNDLLWTILGQERLSNVPVPNINVTGVSLNQRLAQPDDIELASQPTFIHASEGGWDNYVSLFGDYDGDGDGDLSWIRNSNGQIGAVHQAHFNELTEAFVQNQNAQWWPSPDTDYSSIPVKNLIEDNDKIYTIDVNGDGPEDVVVTKFIQEQGQNNFNNRIGVMKGVFGGDPFFNTSTHPQQHPVQQDWENYSHVFVGDVNGDGLQDIIWNNAALDNSIYVALAKSE